LGSRILSACGSINVPRLPLILKWELHNGSRHGNCSHICLVKRNSRSNTEMHCNKDLRHKQCICSDSCFKRSSRETIGTATRLHDLQYNSRGSTSYNSRDILLLRCVQTASATPPHTPSHAQWLRGTLSPERVSDRSPPSTAEVKKAWSYACTSPYTFIACCSGKYRDSFIFTLRLTMCNNI
jgi:hypothetical protein